MMTSTSVYEERTLYLRVHSRYTTHLILRDSELGSDSLCSKTLYTSAGRSLTHLMLLTSRSNLSSILRRMLFYFDKALSPQIESAMNRVDDERAKRRQHNRTEKRV